MVIISFSLSDTELKQPFKRPRNVSSSSDKIERKCKGCQDSFTNIQSHLKKVSCRNAYSDAEFQELIKDCKSLQYVSISKYSSRLPVLRFTVENFGLIIMFKESTICTQ